MSRILTALTFALAVPASLFAKPPWISIELPANPWDQASRGAFLVVHTFHYNRPTPGTLTGTAEGIVNGVRRSIPLSFDSTARPGDFVLRNQWGNAGRWVLVITVALGNADNLAQAVVQIAPDGSVTGVQVPTRQERDVAIPRRVTDAEIAAALRG